MCRQQLQKALVWAISGCRARDGTTPLLVWDFVRVILETHDNSQNPFDDSAFLALLLGSITCVRACCTTSDHMRSSLDLQNTGP